VRTWRDIWGARTLDPSRGSLLAQLMAADGLDTAFGAVTEAHWRRFALDVAGRLHAGPGTSVFDVGCGAGAFLLPLSDHGCRVGGVDQSAALIAHARAAMPDGAFAVADAAALDDGEAWDVVLSCGVFMYFPSLDYAATVLRRMARKARHAVAVLDVPDLALREEAMRLRRGSLGEREYEERYRGLDHLFFEREWIVDVLVKAGLNAMAESQQIAGYANGAHRFNVFASKR